MLNVLIAECEELEFGYEVIGVVDSESEARELAAEDMKQRENILSDGGDPGICPYVYRMFARGDEDGETWTKDGVTVKVECVHPAESRYKWEYETAAPELSSGASRVTNVASGVSGEFNRLLALIGAEVKS